MAVNQPAQTIASVATPVFIRRNLARPWARRLPFLQLGLTKNLTEAREFNVGRMTRSTDTLDPAETFKWGVEATAPTFTESAAGLGIFYTRGGDHNYDVNDNQVDAKQTPFLAHFPLMIPASDIDLFAPAADNERGIKYAYNKMVSGFHAKLTKLEEALLATTQVTGVINSLLATDIRGTGIAGGIGVSHGIDPTDYTVWKSPYTNMNGDRLKVAAIAKSIRDDRDNGASNNMVIAASSPVCDLLIQEAELLNMGTYNIVDVYGADAKGKPRLELESSHSSIRIEGVPLLRVPTLTTVAAGTVLRIDLDQWALPTMAKQNFSFMPWKNVEVEAGKDQQRALFKAALFSAIYDRTKHRRWDNCATS